LGIGDWGSRAGFCWSFHRRRSYRPISRCPLACTKACAVPWCHGWAPDPVVWVGRLSVRRPCTPISAWHPEERVTRPASSWTPTLLWRRLRQRPAFRAHPSSGHPPVRGRKSLRSFHARREGVLPQRAGGISGGVDTFKGPRSGGTMTLGSFNHSISQSFSLSISKRPDLRPETR
jgi:hypothetical protein